MRKSTVQDILKLKIMESHCVAAGMSGLLNEVHYVNVYDNLPAEFDDSMYIFPGDIYLSTLYHSRDDEKLLKDFIEKLISFQASALIVPNENIQVLPSEIISICDHAKLPVIFIDSRTPYSIIISEIMRYQLSFEHRQRLEDKLYSLEDSRVPTNDKEEIILQLNPNFQQNVVCLFYQQKANSMSEIHQNLEENAKIANRLNMNSHNLAASYKDGFLIIHSFSEAHKSEISCDIDEILELIQQNTSSIFMGISRIHDIRNLGVAVSEATTASIAGTIDDNRLSYFQHIGVARILTGLDSSKNIDEFYSDVVTPIMDSDEKYGTELFNTMLTLINQNMNYHATAKQMCVHENTIRYRINRIKEMIPYGTTEMDFYLTITLASKIYKLWKHIV